MNYTDSTFVFVFGFAVAGAFLLRPWPPLRYWFLTTISLALIASWGLFSLGLFLAIAVLNYSASLFLARSTRIVARRILWIAIAFDILTLAAFKYAKFFGFDLSWLTGPVGIPLAISFYTFHAISFLVDLYKKSTSPLKFGHYLFYLSFFPHVVAGPIVRTWQLVPQLRFTRRDRFDWMVGTHFVVTGFFLKSICADNIAGIIDPAWHASTLSTLDRWLVAALYYCQIYADFGGYSLMALGMARLLGFRLPANFRAPLSAMTLQEFWRRWHITLSRWLRDYLYIPLGGNRGTRFRVAANLLITMVLGGFWHGANWGFILWGVIHGCGLAVERWLPKSRIGGITGWMLTQLVVMLAWIPFRLPEIGQAKAFAAGMLSLAHFAPSKEIGFAMIFAAPVVVHQFLPRLIPVIGHRRLGFVLGVMTGVLLICNLVIASPSKVFLYFSF